MKPIQVTASLLGISALSAQAPLSTLGGADPVLGYGLGPSAIGLLLFFVPKVAFADTLPEELEAAAGPHPVTFSRPADNRKRGRRFR